MVKDNLNPVDREPTSGHEFGELALEDIAALILESDHAFVPSVQNPEETTTDLIEFFKTDPLFLIHGYRVDGQAVSYVMALGRPEADTISIGPMYVAKEFRGQGLGREQVCEFIKTYKAKGFSSFYTRTWRSNAASNRIFTQLNFKEIERIKHDRINGDDTVRYLLGL